MINPGYQLRFIFWLTGTGISLIAGLSWLVYRRIRENYEILVDLSPMDEPVRRQLYSELHQMIIYMGGCTSLFLLIVVVCGLLLSHRAAGPLFQFKRVFDLIGPENRKHRIHLRKRDEFHEVAESFNQMMDRLG
jgi:methyl-accepting chemotaxis protein